MNKLVYGKKFETPWDLRHHCMLRECGFSFVQITHNLLALNIYYIITSVGTVTLEM